MEGSPSAGELSQRPLRKELCVWVRALKYGGMFLSRVAARGSSRIRESSANFEQIRTLMKRILALLTFVLATFSGAMAQRLPEVAAPENYKLTFTPDLEKATFEGDETIAIRVLKSTS